MTDFHRPTLVALLLLIAQLLGQSDHQFGSAQTPARINLASVAARGFDHCLLVSSSTQSSGASLRIGGLLELHESYSLGTRQCTRFGDWAAVQQTAMYNFLVNRMVHYALWDANSSIVPFLSYDPPTISSLGFDTCSSGQISVEATLALATDSRVYQNRTFLGLLEVVPGLSENCSQTITAAFERSPPLLGIIGPMSTGSVTAVSPFLSTFSIPHISYWATSSLFDDVTEYDFLFRTVPSDIYQAEAIADLIEHFGWTYVSLVAAEDDEYSGRGFELLRLASTRRKTFCLAVASRFSSVSFLRSQTESVVAAVKNSTARGVVLFAPVSAARYFLDLCHAYGVRDKIFIGSHDWINRIEFLPNTFQSYTPVIGLAPRTIASSTVMQIVEDLRQALNNASYVRAATQSDPWLRAYVEQQLNCSITTPGCSVLAPAETSSRQCEFADFELFQPRTSMAIAESLALSMLSLSLSSINSASPENFLEGTLPSGQKIQEALENVDMRCRDFSGRCRVFDRTHRAAASYYVQNVQQTQEGFHDIIPIGDWEQNRGFRWYPTPGLDLREHGRFFPITNLSAFAVDNSSLPSSNCSQTCRPGQRRVFMDPLPMECCWTCADCESPTFSNTTNADRCLQCPIGFGSDGMVCTEFTPKQHSLASGAPLSVLCVAGLGFFLTLFTLVYFHCHSSAPLVRASDLSLSTVSMVAMLVGYALVPVILIPSTITTAYCTLSAVLGEPIKTIVVSAVLVKTKRVNTVFKSMKVLSRGRRSRFCLSNSMQFIIIALLAFVDIILVLLYAIVDPPNAKRDVFIDRIVLFCDLRILWVCLLSAFNLLLLVTCIVLAFLTRKLPEEYNDAQYLYLASLTGFVVWLGLFPAFLVTGQELRPVISATFLLATLLAFWICLYGSRTVLMLRNKKYRTPKNRSAGPNVVRHLSLAGGRRATQNGLAAVYKECRDNSSSLSSVCNASVFEETVENTTC